MCTNMRLDCSFLSTSSRQVRDDRKTSQDRTRVLQPETGLEYYSPIGAPQGCVLTPLLFSINTNNCTSSDSTVKLLKLAEDTTIIGLIHDGDESAYRQQVDQIVSCCCRNNSHLNIVARPYRLLLILQRGLPALCHYK